MEPFIVNCDITDVNELFCRDNEIKSLISFARRKENVGIIGARRFGKTCILKSMESYIINHPEINAIPIYFDVKSQTTIHKNTSEVYYTLASLLAKRMCEMGMLCEGEYKLSRRCTLDVSTDFLDMQVQMSTWNSEYQQQALFALAEEVSKNNKYVLLLLDEIDALLLDALNTASDFGRIRGAALDKSNKLKIWIAGTAPWKAITTNVGSPELNCGIKPIILSNSDPIAFKKMWEYECSLVAEEKLREKLMSMVDSVFEKTGGVPYYAKFIGSYFINENIEMFPDYTILRDYISEIYNSRFMTDSERSVLNLLSNGEKKFESIPDDVNALISKGIVTKHDDYCFIVFGYMSDYLKAISSNTILQVSSNIAKTERELMVEEIIRLRDNVIRMSKNPPFIPVGEDPISFNILRKECKDNNDLMSFATAICKLYYEGSGMGKLLPENFYAHDFCLMVQALRNQEDHTSENYKPRQMADNKLWSLINSGTRPYKNEHFAIVQMNVLRMFRDELLLMQSYYNPNIIKQENECINTPDDLKNLDEGKYYEGDIVAYGDFLNIKCASFPFHLHIIGNTKEFSVGDRVVFKAITVQNRNDLSKSFWKASDVRLKEDRI